MSDPTPARWVALLAAVTAVSTLHYVTPAASPALHAFYQRLYYVPVILGAYWFGARGGVLVAALCSLAYAPHIHVAWSQNAAYTASQYAELVVFLSLGLAVGLIATRERRLTNRYREAAESLEHANRELRESGEQLRRAERLSALGEIAAGLAHEIRNPLAGMKGALEIVGARAKAGTPEAEFSAIAAREAQRLEGLVQEFLDYARPRPPRRRPGELPQVLRRVAGLLGPEAERAGVVLEIEADAAPSGPPVDPEQIQQVVVNVVLNAIQASPRGGQVRVRSRSEARRTIVEVTDQGPGMAPEARARAFEPFYTTKERGSGLGLAISQRIVVAHGGTIRFEEATGGGTRVEIELPDAGTLPAGA
ncbi:MAG TPA: ATP-binding protein [Vicinamibacterales bacterium]|nr:ATP-binding protein [Acidobacteriota bacterium]HOC16784.1 ATP-binding protein [Vicinamibacterales bacterium]